ncbi:DUF1802 family protein [Mycobacterium sp. OTB74]|uniref:DUF1802 family protein n=1 Tax=Mycobacterium sp. OTB74 TaxID=1853452 RepID=UPI0024767080|nr:DUF1802 family protein [Mycobacterium sp. OTB74]MDH6244935.1 hypothetical protein [Mycobacterium sp. OTB74]
MNSPALKEWGAAVLALLDGRQCVLLRKGGIHEKRFALPAHVRSNPASAPQFVFFPTVAHSHAERVRPEHHSLVTEAEPDSTDSTLVIRGGAKVVAAVEVNRPEHLDDLAGLHIWTAGSVREDRLDFRPRHRLTVLVVQARPLTAPVTIARSADYAGCRSWVDLPLDPQWGAPVHDEATLQAVAAKVRTSVG